MKLLNCCMTENKSPSQFRGLNFSLRAPTKSLGSLYNFLAISKESF